MRCIDADKLSEVKFHSLPYTHITPSDVEAESYKRGWNDAIDSIIENHPTIEPERKKGKWIVVDADIAENSDICECDKCSGRIWRYKNVEDMWNYCPRCGADMREEQDG